MDTHRERGTPAVQEQDKQRFCPAPAFCHQVGTNNDGSIQTLQGFCTRLRVLLSPPSNDPFCLHSSTSHSLAGADCHHIGHGLFGRERQKRDRGRRRAGSSLCLAQRPAGVALAAGFRWSPAAAKPPVAVQRQTGQAAGTSHHIYFCDTNSCLHNSSQGNNTAGSGRLALWV